MAASLILLLLFVSVGGLFVRARAVPSTSIPMHVSDLGSQRSNRMGSRTESRPHSLPGDARNPRWSNGARRDPRH